MHCEILKFRVISDDDGALISLEQNKNIPFDIKRVYYIFNTRSDFVRGRHSHKNLQQILVCVKGSCTISLDDGSEKTEILLNSPDQGLLVKSNIWREMYNFSPDCVLMVLADSFYDEQDYIRNYQEFVDYVSRNKTK